VKGERGLDGLPGRDGLPGEKGSPGIPGVKGMSQMCTHEDFFSNQAFGHPIQWACWSGERQISCEELILTIGLESRITRSLAMRSSH